MVWSVLVSGKVSLGGECRGRMGKETKAAGSEKNYGSYSFGPMVEEKSQ